MLRNLPLYRFNIYVLDFYIMHLLLIDEFVHISYKCKETVYTKEKCKREYKLILTENGSCGMEERERSEQRLQ